MDEEQASDVKQPTISLILHCTAVLTTHIIAKIAIMV